MRTIDSRRTAAPGSRVGQREVHACMSHICPRPAIALAPANKAQGAGTLVERQVCELATWRVGSIMPNTLLMPRLWTPFATGLTSHFVCVFSECGWRT